MNILVITNIYPPQELGGYGRSIADFAWGLKERGNKIQVLCSDQPEMGESSNTGPSGECVDRRLLLKGSYSGGVRHIRDQQKRTDYEIHNVKLVRQWLSKKDWGGILVGNLDLLGAELLVTILEGNCQSPAPYRICTSTISSKRLP